MRTSSGSQKVGSSSSNDKRPAKKAEIAPPLPLLKFLVSEKVLKVGPKTINGEELKSIPNDLYGSNDDGKVDGLSDPIRTRRLARWFTARSQREANYRQMEMYNRQLYEISSEDMSSYVPKGDLFDYIIYESLMHLESKDEREERNTRRITEEQIHLIRTRQREQQMATVTAKTTASCASRNKKGIAAPSKKSVSSSSSKVNAKNTGTSNGNDDADNDDDISVASSSSTNSARNVSLSPVSAFSPSITFDAEFESGNLEKVARVVGRETLLTSKQLENLSEYQVPHDVDQEYDLTVRNDLYTDGNIQWYYFRATVDESQGQSFPLRVRFNLVNMQKKDSLYNYGMKPALLSIHENRKHGQDWTHGGYDISYFKNGFMNNVKTAKKRKQVRNQFTLSFSYTFLRPDTVYFAHAFPYTYSDLQRYLHNLETNSQLQEFFHRRILCDTLAGNHCDLLTITERSDGIVESRNKPAVIISARVHPGETNSSFMIQGVIDFLVSDCVEARRLRKAFIFSIIPMLNPDGVIHGNYRCSLAGTDLNRRYIDAHCSMHPTIVALKELVKNIRSNRPIEMYIDLHGHSKSKNSFVYGCDLLLQPEKYAKLLQANFTTDEINAHRIHCRVFPKILCTVSRSDQLPLPPPTPSTSGKGLLSGFPSPSKMANNPLTALMNADLYNSRGYFSYRDCAFAIQKSKMGTGRVVCWKDLGIVTSYTIETSFCGNGNNAECRLLKKYFDQTAASSVLSRSSRYAAANNNNTSAIPSSNTATSSCDPIAEADHRDSMTSKASRNTSNDSGTLDDDSDVQDGNLFAGIDSFLSNPSCNVDSVLQGILQAYKTDRHYQKDDYINMGKHIVQALYHHANLAHADLEFELKQARMKNEEEIRKRGEMQQHLNDLGMFQLRRGARTTDDILSAASKIKAFANKNAGDSLLTSETVRVSSSSSSTNDTASNNAPSTSASNNNNVSEANRKHARPSTSSVAVRSTVLIKEALTLSVNPTNSPSKPSPSSTGSPSTKPSPPVLSAEQPLDGAKVPAKISPKDGKPKEKGSSGFGGLFGFHTSTIGSAHQKLETALKQKEDIKPAEEVLPIVASPAPSTYHQLMHLDEAEIDMNSDEDDEEDDEDDDDSEADNDSQTNSSKPTEGDSASNNPADPLLPSSSGSGKRRGSKKEDAVQKAILAELLEQYRNLKVQVVDKEFLSRLLPRPTVFNFDALQQLLDSHAAEFVFMDRLTFNVCLRAKCELAIRRSLGLDSCLRLDKLMALENQYKVMKTVPPPSTIEAMEEDNEEGSVDGSDSNPSVDNQHASSLLKNLAKYKDTNSLVDALRHALQQKRKKEINREKKKQQKVISRLAKQAEAAKRQQQELEKQQLLQQQQTNNALAKRRTLTFRESNSLRPKSGGAMRATAAALATPKYVTPPNIKLAPEAKVNIPIQIRMMNFKDYDHNYQYIQQQVLSQQRLLQQMSTQQGGSRRNSMAFAEQNQFLNFPVNEEALLDDRNVGNYFSFVPNGGGSFSAQNDHPLAFPSFATANDGIASPVFNQHMRAGNLMASENLAGLLPSLTSPNAAAPTTGSSSMWNPPLSARNSAESSSGNTGESSQLPSSPAKRHPPSSVDEFLRAAKPKKKTVISIDVSNVGESNPDSNSGLKAKKPIGPPVGLIKTLLSPEKPLGGRDRPMSSPHVRRSANYSISNNKIVI